MTQSIKTLKSLSERTDIVKGQRTSNEKACEGNPSVTDMKARTMSLAHRRVMKTTFEPLKDNTDTRPGESVNNQKNNHRPRLVITRPGASVNIQTSSVAKELHHLPMGE